MAYLGIKNLVVNSGFKVMIINIMVMLLHSCNNDHQSFLISLSKVSLS